MAVRGGIKATITAGIAALKSAGILHKEDTKKDWFYRTRLCLEIDMTDRMYELMYGKRKQRSRSHRELAEEHRRLAKYHESAYLKHLHRSEGQKKREKKFERHDRLIHREERAYESKHHRSLATERREDRKHRHVGFTALERKVYEEYKRRGYSDKKAKEYTLRTAGKVYWEIARRR